jgi:hypothetical protein
MPIYDGHYQRLSDTAVDEKSIMPSITVKTIKAGNLGLAAVVEERGPLHERMMLNE